MTKHRITNKKQREKGLVTIINELPARPGTAPRALQHLSTVAQPPTLIPALPSPRDTLYGGGCQSAVAVECVCSVGALQNQRGSLFAQCSCAVLALEGQCGRKATAAPGVDCHLE